MKEECGLTAKKLFKHGILWFEVMEPAEDFIHEVHLFSTAEFEGCITESDGEFLSLIFLLLSESFI